MALVTQETFTLRNQAGDAYTLTGPIHVAAHAGLGMAPVARAVRSGPQQHGQTLASARLEPRVITLRLIIDCDSEDEIREERAEIETLLAGIEEALYLDTTLPDGSVRRLDVYYADGFTGERAADGPYYSTEDTLQLVADDPVAYDTETQVAWFELATGGTGMPIPLEVPLTVGEADVDHSLPINYPGTWLCYPVIRIYGPLDDACLTNESTDEALDFDGTLIANGAWYDIDLRYGYKTVQNAVGANRIADLTDDSDLATFHLAAHPEAPGGVNVLRLTGTGAGGNTACAVTYWNRYLGVV